MKKNNSEFRLAVNQPVQITLKETDQTASRNKYLKTLSYVCLCFTRDRETPREFRLAINPADNRTLFLCTLRRPKCTETFNPLLTDSTYRNRATKILARRKPPGGIHPHVTNITNEHPSVRPSGAAARKSSGSIGETYVTYVTCICTVSAARRR